MSGWELEEFLTESLKNFALKAFQTLNDWKDFRMTHEKLLPESLKEFEKLLL